MGQKAFQDYYEDAVSYCYGCGRLNEHGYQIKSYWEGEDAVCRFHPEPYHIAIPGYVYGGLIASLIDCHATGTAAAAAHRDQGRPMDEPPYLRFVTASLHVDYLKPTPIDATLELRAQATEIEGRKVTVSVSVLAEGVETARGRVVAVQIPDRWLEEARERLE
jgi:acyl-coenzyme A thioesterase PaaI-like protein